MKTKRIHSLKSARIMLLAALTLHLFAVLPLFSQSGPVIAGRVIDSSNGEAIVGAGVIIRPLAKATTTDINGNYRLTGVPAGSHTVEFVMMGYERASAQVSVGSGVTTLNVTLSYSTVNEVVVTAKRVSNTDAALLSKRKKAPVAQDAISAEQISKSPDSNAADVAKRVTGVTIVDGDNVYIRGLGERYSSVTFAGSTLPSPNPDKRVVPLDIFPAALLDNMVVVKGYTPDMSGDFGGGVVEINPKDYPDGQLLSVSIGTSWHSNTRMNIFGITTPGETFYSYDGGKNDFWGYDDGTRKVPSGVKDAKVDTYDAKEIEKIGEAFNRTYTPEKSTPYLPLDVKATYGNSFKLSETSRFGVIVSGLFKESSEVKQYEYYQVNGNLEKQRSYEINTSTYSTSAAGLLSLGYTGSVHKFRFTTNYSHQSEDSTKTYEGYNRDLDGSNQRTNVLKFIEQSLWFNQLSGEHMIVNGIKGGWVGTFSIAQRSEPNTRQVDINNRNSSTMRVEEADDISIMTLDHTDTVYDIAPYLSFNFKQWGGLDSKLKLGGGYTYRERDSRGRIFQWSATQRFVEDGDGGELSLPVDTYFTDGNITGGYGGDGLLYIAEAGEHYGEYKGDLTVAAGYAQVDLPLVSKLRFVGGARYEFANMDVRYWDSTEVAFVNLDDNPIEQHNIMPSVNLTYSFTNDINLRAGFSKTVARPDFREVTPFEYPSLVSNEKYKGNPDLVQTDIFGYDLRLEFFPSPEEIFALSAFYKHLEKPIEMLTFSNSSSATFYSFSNANSADNLGAEFEAKKNLGFINPLVQDFSVSTNLAYIYSQIKVTDLSSVNYTNEKRALQGQSPYVVNAGMHYDNDKSGTSVSLLYNIFGPRIVGVGTVTGNDEWGDIYEQPNAKLDLVFRQKLFTKAGMKFTASNILDPEIKQTQKIKDGGSGKSETVTLKKYRDGRKFGVSLSYDF